MTEIAKEGQPKQRAKAEEPKKTEAALDDKQLDQVAGGIQVTKTTDQSSPPLFRG